VRWRLPIRRRGGRPRCSRSARAWCALRAVGRAPGLRGIRHGRRPRCCAVVTSWRSRSWRAGPARRIWWGDWRCARGHSCRRRRGRSRACLTSCWSTPPAGIIRAVPGWRCTSEPPSGCRRSASRTGRCGRVGRGRTTRVAHGLRLCSTVTASARGCVRGRALDHLPSTPVGGPRSTWRSRWSWPRPVGTGRPSRCDTRGGLRARRVLAGNAKRLLPPRAGSSRSQAPSAWRQERDPGVASATPGRARSGHRGAVRPVATCGPTSRVRA
jgi:hypothetical protein